MTRQKPTTLRVRTSSYAITAATYETYRTREPDIDGHVHRDRLRYTWHITPANTGRVLASGRTWTRNGAWAAAIQAAHQPGILRSGR